MAKKRAINKSALVREYKVYFPRSRPRDIVKALAAPDVQVSPQAVSSILSLAKRTGKLVPRVKKHKPSRPLSDEVANALDGVFAVKPLSSAIDPVENAKLSLEKIAARRASRRKDKRRKSD